MENHKTRLVHILYYSLNRTASMYRHLYLSPLTTLKDASNIMSMQRHVHSSLLLLIYHYNTETGATASFHWYTIIMLRQTWNWTMSKLCQKDRTYTYLCVLMLHWLNNNILIWRKCKFLKEHLQKMGLLTHG